MAINININKNDLVSCVPEWLDTMISTNKLPASLEDYDLGRNPYDGTKFLQRDNRFSWWMVRDVYISHFGYPVLTKQVLSEIVEMLKIKNIRKTLEVARGWLVII